MLSSPVSNLEILDKVVGKHVLDWSDDHCLAVATGKDVILYELNPLKNVNSTGVGFHMKEVSVGPALNYNAGVKNILNEFHDRRALPSKTAALPNINLYQMFLDPSIFHLHKSDQEENTFGVLTVKFSPLGCSFGDGTVLGTLTQKHRLQLFSRVSDGKSIKWTEVADISDRLIKILKQNNNYYPGMKLSAETERVNRLWEKQLAACTNDFVWSGVLCRKSSEEKFVYLTTYMKCNFILIWELSLPICYNSKISLLSCTKSELNSCACLSSLETAPYSSKYFNFAVGSSEGQIKCIEANGESGSIGAQTVIWQEKDHLSVSDISWTEEEGFSSLLAAKGCFILYLRLSSDFHVLSSSTLRVSSFSLLNIERIKRGSWLTGTMDGSVLKVWTEKCDEQGAVKLRYSVVSESNSCNSPCPETMHGMVISPHRTLLACLSSKAKVTATIMIDESAFMDIKTFQQEKCSMKTLFQKLLSQLEVWGEDSEGDGDVYPPLDLIEMVRRHVNKKNPTLEETDVVLHRNMLRQFVESQNGHLQMKWYAAKILTESSNGRAQDCVGLLMDIEKKIVARQMMKVLKLWLRDSAENTSLPIRNIVKWLNSDRHFLSFEDVAFLKQVENSDKFSRTEVEKCAVTGETLLMSDDARWAVTEGSKMEWPRCCFTFCALQEFKTRKCEVCGARTQNADISDQNVRTLLKDRSIYSSCSMI